MSMRLFLVVLALSSGLARAQVVDITTIGVVKFPLFFTLEELEELTTIQISPANLMK